MEILQQCQIWNGNGEYKKIVDALEAIPAEERTPEMDSELARAYNNLAAPSDRELFKRLLPCCSLMRNILQVTTAGISVWVMLITILIRRDVL